MCVHALNSDRAEFDIVRFYRLDICQNRTNLEIEHELVLRLKRMMNTAPRMILSTRVAYGGISLNIL